MKETIKYTDDTEHEFDIYRLGLRKVRALIDKYLPLDEITLDKDKTPVMPEGFKNSSLFDLMEECLGTIKGLDMKKIQAEEVGRIYDKYFANSIKMGMSGKGDPK